MDGAGAVYFAQQSAESFLKVTTFFTPKEAAQFLGMDEKTITRWARNGYIPAHPLGEGKRRFWRFLPEELTAWLLRSTNQPEAGLLNG